MDSIRFIQDSKRAGAMNMGIDEAVLQGVMAGTSEPTLRLYGWTPPTLTIGYFQSMADEADLAACEAVGVKCIRRVTGGGAVFHEHEVTYSLVAPIGYAGIPEVILDSYEYICRGIIRGLSRFGIEVDFVPLNDLTTLNRKISGNAQTRKHGVILQHGTILLDVDVEKMFSILKVPSEKMKDKLIKSVKERVVGLKELTGQERSFEEVSEALRAGFFESIRADFKTGSLSAAELDSAREYAQSKYSNDAWNKRR